MSGVFPHPPLTALIDTTPPTYQGEREHGVRRVTPNSIHNATSTTVDRGNDDAKPDTSITRRTRSTPQHDRRRRHQKTSSYTLSESREKRTVDRRSTTANTNTQRDERRRREQEHTRVTPRVLEPRSRTWTVAVDDADDVRTPSTSSRSRVTNHDDDQPRPQRNATQLTTDSTTHADRAPSR